MSRLSKILGVIVVVETLAIAVLGGYLAKEKLRDPRRSQETDTGTQVTDLADDQDVITPVDKVDLQVKLDSTIVWWDQDSGFESVKSNAKYIDAIWPFWYELDADGEIIPFSGAADSEIMDFAEANDIDLIPIISNEFEAEPLAGILADEAKRAAHIADIVEVTESYDGVSLNYENLGADDRENYTQFFAEIADELHSRDKLLGVHLHAKTSEQGTWNGPASQDWKELGKSCDRLKIMAYDYHWSTSEAGAIAPQDWVEEVVEFGASKIPAEKISLGVPLYGYDWVGELGEDVTYESAMKLAESEGVSVQTDEETMSSFFEYDKGGEEHEVWFENAESTRLKLELAKEYELGSVSFFRLGGEDEGIWKVVGETLI